MATVDNLDIQIKSSAQTANQEINKLIMSLGKLATALKIDTHGLEKIGKSLNLGEISKSAQNIQPQVQKVTKTLAQLTEQYKDLGKGFEIKGSTQQIQKQIDSLTNKLANAKLAKDDFEASGKTNLGGYETAVKNVIKYTNQIESLKKQLAGLQTTQPQSVPLIIEASSMTKSLSDYEKNLADFKNGMEAIFKRFGGISEVSKGYLDTPINNLKTYIEELKQSFPGATEVISAFEKELQRLQEISKVLTKEPIKASADTSALDRLNERITELKQKFEKTGMDFKFTGNFEQLNAEIKKAYSELDGFLAKEREMVSAGKVNTPSFEQLQESIARAGNKIPILEDLKERTESFNRSLQQLRVPEIREENLTKLQNSLRKTEEETEKLRTKLANQITMGNIIPNIDDSGFRKLTEQIALSEKRAEALRAKIQGVDVASGGANNTTGRLNLSLSSFINHSNKSSSAANVLEKNIKKLSSSMNKLQTSAKKAMTGMKSFARQALAAMGIYLGVYGAVKGFMGAIKNAMNYVEILNYFNKSFLQVAENVDISQWEELGYKSAEAYANSFAERAKQLTGKITGFNVSDTGELTRTSAPSLGLNPTEVMNYQAMFAQMSSSIGTTSEQALKLSNALTMIGADLASVKNMKFGKTWEDMASGLAGMSRTLDKYGVNIRNVNLQQKLNELGIQANISKLNQNDKALLRTIILLDSTRYAWGDLASTINQPANQLRLLQANFASLGTTIGSLFIPIIKKVLPYINALVISVQRLFAWIAGLFGIKLSNFVSSVGSASDGMGYIADEADSIANGFDNASKAAKGLRKTLRSYDELNVAPDKNESSGAGDGAGAGGIPELDMALDEILDEYQKAWDEAFANMENTANEMADKIVEAFHKIKIAAIPVTASLIRLREEGLSKLGDFTWGTLQDFWNNFLKPIGLWMLSDDSGLARFFRITNSILNEIDWGRLKNSLSDFYSSLVPLTQFVWTALMDFYDFFLKPIAIWTMGEGLPQLIDILTNFINTIHWGEINKALAELWKALSPFATSVGQGLVNFFGDLLSIGAEFINSVVPKGLTLVANGLNSIKPETAEKIGYALGVMATGLLALKGISSIATMLSAFSTSLAGLSASISPIVGLFAKGGLFSSSGLIASALTTLQGAIAALTGVTVPIGVIVAAIAAVVATLIDLWNTSEVFRNSVIAAFEKIKLSLVGAFDKIKAAIMPFITSIKDLAASIYDFYQNSPTKAIIELFATLAATIGGTILSTAIDALSTAFSGLIGIFTGAIEILDGVFQIFSGLFSLDFDKINEGLEKLCEGIETALEGVIEGTFGLGSDIAEGLYEGILDIISNVKEWLKEHVSDPFVNGLKDLLDIHSPSMVMKEIGNALMEGLLNGIKELVDSIIKPFQEIKENILKKWEEIKEDATDKWEETKKTISEKWENIKADISDKSKKVFDDLSKKWSEIKTTTSTKWNEIKDDISQKWTNIKTDMTQKADGIKTELTNSWNNIKTSISGSLGDILSNIISSFSDMFSNVSSKVGDIYNVISDGFGNAVDFIKDLGSSAWDWGSDLISGFVDGIWDSIGEVTNAVKGVANKVTSYLHFSKPDIGPLREYEKWMPDFMKGLARGITNNAGLVERSLSALTKDMNFISDFAMPNFAEKYGINVMPDFATKGFNNIDRQTVETTIPSRDSASWIDTLADRIAFSINAQNNTSYAQPIPVEVVIEGELKNFIKAIVRENNSYRKQTGMSMF